MENPELKLVPDGSIVNVPAPAIVLVDDDGASLRIVSAPPLIVVAP